MSSTAAPQDEFNSAATKSRTAARPVPAGSVRTADDVELALYRWPSTAPAKATVALLHGLAEHAGRYAALAERFGAAGIELVALDLRGHGRSPGERAWVTRFDAYLDDARALLDAASQPNIPLFLMGHSMGGTIATLFAIERLETFVKERRPVAGLILSSPALAPGKDVPRWMLAASRIVSRLWPRYKAMKIEPALLSRDALVVEANRTDPLVHHDAVPARTGEQILAAMARIEQGRASLRLPVLVFHGTADKLTEPEGSRAFAAHAGSSDRTLMLYEGAYHETMNDLDRDRAIDALIEWILARA
ncbi:alpha/beta hydrolase [Trinickia diaoshuihuensis]|jgi:alpha-beta hydrolase superfamily lysophospholipase|uniref:alpha/beta hydrolase n=1 Tax=Trinickia diaoshuihuensis TaxID=2292265 RepID=UPI000E25A949|nr:alpha/beta hydrolase [Trinickia diaoshuihuensis]